ncbi:MAG: GxxExxY protein [Isosphaeraceae bacterium]
MVMIHGERSHSIVGAAMTVLNTLKPGLDEKIDERALKIELLKRGHRFESQRRFPVFYDGQDVGTLIPDLIVDGPVLVDTKVVRAFHDSHVAQMIGYLAITELRIGLLLNFRFARLISQRVVR